MFINLYNCIDLWPLHK